MPGKEEIERKYMSVTAYAARMRLSKWSIYKYIEAGIIEAKRSRSGRILIPVNKK